MKKSFSFFLLAILVLTAACSHEPTLSDELADLKLDGPDTAAAAPLEDAVPSESLGGESEFSPLSESSVRESRPKRKIRKAKKRHGKKKKVARRHKRKHRKSELARRNRGE